jgi:hypothetical protein
LAGLGTELAVGLGAGLVYKLYAGFAAGLSSGEIATKAMPNEGIHRSARIALVTGLGAGLGVGLAIGIRYGGRAYLQHLLLRLGSGMKASPPGSMWTSSTMPPSAFSSAESAAAISSSTGCCRSTSLRDIPNQAIRLTRRLQDSCCSTRRRCP